MLQPTSSELTPADIQNAFAERRRRQIILSTVFLVGIALLRSALERASDTLTVSLFIGFIGAFFIGTRKNWRCPACGRYLGKRLNPCACQHCGAALRPLDASRGAVGESLPDSSDELLRFQQSFGARQKGQIAGWIAAVASTAAVFTCADLDPASAYGNLRVPGLVLFSLLGLAAVGFVVQNWRCPVCRRPLGRSISPRFCPTCAAPLRSLPTDVA